MCKDNKFVSVKRRITRAALELDDFRELTNDNTVHALLDATEQQYEMAIQRLEQRAKRPNACVCVKTLPNNRMSPKAIGHPAMAAARDKCLEFRHELWTDCSPAVDCFERAYSFLNAAIKVLVDLELRDRVATAKKEPTPISVGVGN